MATIAGTIKANATLRAAKQNYPEIERLGNAPTSIANPIKTAPQVPKPIELAAILTLVPSSERVAIRAMNEFVGDLRAAIDNQDRVYLATLLEDAATSGAIKPATVAKLQPLLSATIADPTYSATVPGPSIFEAAGLGYVTKEQIQAADNAGGFGGSW